MTGFGNVDALAAAILEGRVSIHQRQVLDNLTVYDIVVTPAQDDPEDPELKRVMGEYRCLTGQSRCHDWPLCGHVGATGG